MPCSSSTMHSFRTALLLTIPTWFTQFTLPTDRLAGQRSLCKIHHPYTACLHISHCSPPVPPWPFVLMLLSQKLLPLWADPPVFLKDRNLSQAAVLKPSALTPSWLNHSGPCHCSVSLWGSERKH